MNATVILLDGERVRDTVTNAIKGAV